MYKQCLDTAVWNQHRYTSTYPIKMCIRDRLVTYKASGYGLKNVNDRMQLLYGMEYGIKVFSQIDQGTRVEMRIPREKADEEAVAAGEFSTKKFLQEPEEDTEDTTGKKGGKSEEKK